MRCQGKIKRQIVYEESRLEEMGMENLGMMHQIVKILPEGLKAHPNYKNYFFKYGAYAFTIDKSRCKHLCKLFINGFAAGLKEYLNEAHQLYHALIIKKKVYLGYN